MPKNEDTEYLFASSCFNAARRKLKQADASPRERLVAALESLARIVFEDLPYEAQPHFQSICNAIEASSELSVPIFDSKSLPDVIANMHDSDVEEIEMATLTIASYVDERRRV